MLYRKDADSEPYCVCALGSQDGSVSFWMSCSARAPLVSQNLFDGPVFDICWDAAGRTVLACSSDGTVAAFQFDEQAFGEPVAPQDLHSMLSKYGYRGGGRDGRLVPENPAQLLMESAAAKKLAAAAAAKNPFSVESSAAAASPFKQRAGGGSIAAILGTSPTKVQHQAFSSVFEGKRRVQPTLLTTSNDQQQRQSSMATVPQSDILRIQQTTTTASGKRRVQPVMVQSSPQKPAAAPVVIQSAAMGSNAAVALSNEQLEKAIQLANVPVTIPAYKPRTAFLVEADGGGCTFSADNQGIFLFM